MTIMRNHWNHIPPEGHQRMPCDNTSRYVLAQVSRWSRTGEPLHPESAMEIAAWWHSPAPRDEAITAFSHSGTIMIDDLESNVRRYLETAHAINRNDRMALYALLDYVTDVIHVATRYRRSVWHGGGHRWYGTGEIDRESCITCGGEWALRPDSSDGDYGSYYGGLGLDGKPELANDCTRRTDLVHGYERHCEADNGRECEAARDTGTCEHIDHECNCLLCD